jgi:type I restriction enzyme, S subunit
VTDIMTLASPNGWQLYRLGQLFRERKQKGSDKDFPPLSVTMGGIVPQLETAAKSDDGDNRKIVRVGDYAINSRSDRKGSGGISAHEGSVSLISIVLEPRKIDPRFAHHLLRSPAFQEEFYRWGHGIVADLWTTRYADMKNIRLRVPDIAIQRQVADFLDRETTRIDLLIEKKQRLVALLGQKVRSDIHELFQSLDAKNWRIRHLGRVKNGAGFPIDLQGDASNEIPFFKVKHLSVNGLDQRITESKDTITEETARTLRATVFPEGTIVFAKIGAALLLGRFSMLGNKGCIDNNLAAFGVNKRLVDPDYLLLCFERFEMQLMVQPGAVPSLSTEKFINQSVPLPSMEGQRDLVGKVRQTFQRNKRIVQRTQDSIDRLKEYRSALITAAVTGQINVQTYAKSGTPDRRLDAIQEEMGA